MAFRKNINKHQGRTRLTSAHATTQAIALGLGFALGCGFPLVHGQLLSFASLPGHPRSDFEYYFYPLRCFLGRVWGSGWVPLWNPHLFCGYPVIESVQSALFYVPNSLALVFSPVPALAWLTTLHLVLSYLFGVVALWRGFGYSFVASAIAAALPNVSAIYPLRLFAGHLTIVFCLPWTLLVVSAFYKLASCASRHEFYLWWLVGVVGLGSVWTAGAPQFAVYTTAACLVVGLAASFSVRSLRVLVSALIAGTLLALPQILIPLDYVRFSARAGNWGHEGSAPGVWSTLLATLLPYPFGNGVTELHVNQRGVWDTSAYFGVCGLLAFFYRLTLCTCDIRKSARARTILSLVLLWLYLAGGGWFPGLRAIRESQRAVVLIVLAATVCLAWQLDELVPQASSCTNPRRRQWRRFLLLGIGWLGLLLATQFWVNRSWQSLFAAISRQAIGQIALPFAASDFLNNYLRGTLERAIHFALVATSLLVAVQLVGLIRPKLGWFLVGGLALLEPGLHNLHGYKCRTPIATMGVPQDVLKQINALNSRSWEEGRPPFRWRIPLSLTNAAMTVEGLFDMGGYDPLMPQLAMARRFCSYRLLNEVEKNFFIDAVHGVAAQVSEPFAQPEFVPPQCRAYTVSARKGGHELCIASLESRFELQPPTYSFGPIEDTTNTVSCNQDLEMIYQWVNPSLQSTMFCAAETAKPPIKWYRPPPPNMIRVLTRSSRPAILILRITWLPGWRLLNKEGLPATKPIRCNGWMLGIPVRAGVSLTTLQYVPPAWRVSWFIALSAFAFVISLTTHRFALKFWLQRARLSTARA